MDNELAKMIVPTVLSGVFGLLTAAIPVYLQQRKPKAAVLRDLAAGKFGRNAAWTGVLVLLFTLFWSGFFSVTAVILMAVPVGLGPTSDASAEYIAIFQDDGSLAKIPAAEFFPRALEDSFVFEWVSFIGDFLMIWPMFLVGRYAGRRLDRFGIPVLLGGVVGALAIIEISNRIDGTAAKLQYEYQIPFLVIHLAVALAGYTWARRHRMGYLLARAYRLMGPEDRRTLLELAHSAAEPRLSS